MAKYAEPLKEAGKGLIALGNIGSGLLFVQSFWEMSKLSGLVVSVIWLISLYAAGTALINTSNKRRSK